MLKGVKNIHKIEFLFEKIQQITHPIHLYLYIIDNDAF